MRNVLWTLLLVVICSTCGSAADSFHAEAEATGTIVLWFAGQSVTVDLRAEVTLSGSLLQTDASTAFTATARATGAGTANLDTLAVDVWIAVTGQGETESGAAIAIRGGFALTALDAATMTSASGQGSGHLYLLITTPDGCWVLEGEAAGGISGSFVVPDDPYSMQVAATGSFILDGEPQVWNSMESGALPEWPAELVAELARQAALQATGEN
jgi:hypothetical protein